MVSQAKSECTGHGCEQHGISDFSKAGPQQHHRKHGPDKDDRHNEYALPCAGVDVQLLVRLAMNHHNCKMQHHEESSYYLHHTAVLARSGCSWLCSRL